jgi:serine/threonine-protein kinase
MLGKLSVREAISVMKDVARALVYAHDRGIVHRDIKPDNILLTSGAAMLADFGVAKAVHSAMYDTGGDEEHNLTGVGMSLGTPAYMAPEQVAADENTDQRADIYALGITAYEMLAGAPPFRKDTRGALLTAHLTETPEHISTVRDDTPGWFAELIMRCLEKDPAQRPQSADDLVEALGDPSRTTGGSTAVMEAPGTTRSSKRKILVGSVAAAVVLAAGAFAVGTLFPSGAGNFAGPSIAVLPFVNVGGNPDDEYFADGLTDELITALNRVPTLRVASRTAVFAHKGSNASVQELGDALSVSTLLEGTIRRGGDRLRLTARLVDGEDGLALWTETFERQITDVFAVQDEVSQSIATALRDQLGVEAGDDAAIRRGTADLEAYDLYLRGRYFFARRGDDALRTALGYFEQAVGRDSSYAEAYTGIADVLGLLPLYSAIPSDSVLPLALQAADRAIELDSTLASAYASRGNLLNAAWQWSDAERDMQRAVNLDPKNATAHQWFGEQLLLAGRVDESVTQLERGSALDPLSPVITASHAIALGVSRRLDEATAMAQRAVELDTASTITRLFMGAVYSYAGRFGEAIPELESAMALAPGLPAVKGFVGYAYAKAGQRGDALQILATIDSTALSTGAGVAIARIRLGLGEFDAAVEWLDRAVNARDPFFNSESLASPIFDPIRGHPGFVGVVQRLGLPETLATPR